MHDLIVVLLFCHSSWVFYQVEGNPYSSELLGSGGGDVGGGRPEQWGPERGQPPAAGEGGLHFHLIGSYRQASMINIKSRDMYVLPSISHTSLCLWKKLNSITVTNM